MKIRNIDDIPKHFKVGDEVWACAFEYDSYKEGRALFQVPVLGVFTNSRTGAKNKDKLKNSSTARIKYFVPLKKDGIEPMYSKVVNLESRCYATTKEECIELYHELINERIEWHRNKIEKLIEEKNKVK